MKRSSSSHPIKLFSAESPSSSFSDPRISGAELKEGAAQFPPRRRPPPEPPDPATPPGQENDETDRRRSQLYQLVGHTTSHPESPTIRPPLRSISLNLPRESSHQPQIKFLAEFPPCQRPPIRVDSRLQCIPQGSLLPSTPPIPVQASPTSEVTMPHANSEMVLCNGCAIITPFPVMPGSNMRKIRRSLDALSTRSLTLIPEPSGQRKDESQAQQQTIIQPPIVDNDLYVQQCMIMKGSWLISDKAKARISMKMDGEPLIDGHPIAKCILNKFQNFESYRGDIACCRRNPKEIFTAELCTTRNKVLLPYWMDSSTEKLENEFAKQFQSNLSITWPGDPPHDITVPTLVVIMYRSAYGVSIFLEHFVNSGCPPCVFHSLQVQQTLIKLKEAHDTTCRKLRSRNCEKSWGEIAAACKELIIYGVYQYERWLIEYPHFVEIHLRSSGKIIPCLYMQIPPFCFAVPLFESDGSRDSGSYHLLQSHFTPAVHEINRQLLIERESFLKQKPELRNKENLGLIYPYRFGSEAECRHLHITIYM